MNMLKKLISIGLALTMLLVLSSPLMAGPTHVGNGVTAGGAGISGGNPVINIEGIVVDVGNGVLVGVRSGDYVLWGGGTPVVLQGVMSSSGR
jgi:hypothetical protein